MQITNDDPALAAIAARMDQEIPGEHVCRQCQQDRRVLWHALAEERGKVAALRAKERTAHRCYLRDCGYVCPKHRTVYLYGTPLPSTGGGVFALPKCPEPDCGKVMLSLCALNDDELRADLLATRARLAEVARERDEWKDDSVVHSKRAVRAEAERDAAREERDCAAGWAEENDRLGRRCNTLTATLREVREALDRAKILIEDEFGYEPTESLYRGETIERDARPSYDALCLALARCDAVLKERE